jgi:penicillin-binding protein 2
MNGGFSSFRDGTISKSRVLALGGIIGAVFILYSLYLFNLQVLNTELYQKRATQVTQRSIPIYAQRGEIYDRNYDVPIVSNIDSFAVDIIPGEIPAVEKPALYEKLAAYLNISVEEIGRKIPPNYADLFQPIEIKSGISLDTIIYLAEHIGDYPGVAWHNKPIRNYVEKESLAHVLGYVGDITREELQVLYNKGYSFGSVLGKSGIEKQYDQILRGEDGKQFRTVDARGRKVGEALMDEIPPSLGKHLVLTIDRHIQELCEKALGNRIGTVIAMKPASGEILALVSHPSYDPNIFYESDSGRTFRELALDTTYPFLNRAIQTQYVPASAFKIIMTAAIVEEEVFPVNKTVFCSGSIQYGDRVFRCHKHSGHGALSLYDALAESCDVYYYTLGTDYLGVERIVDFSRKFGLGERTGIDIPGEISGTLPSPAWKSRVFNSRWVGGDTVNMSIGQGFLMVTPLQMANAVSLIVNEGVVYKPHLLKEIRDPVSGDLIESVKPEELFTSTIRNSTFKHVQEAMRKVITSGTAKVVITTDAVQVAGKTGTGEIGVANHYHSWFVAYAPFESGKAEDKIVLVVLVEAVNEWEWWAPKASNIILHGIFSKMTYEEVVGSLNTWYLRADSQGER